ncbi:MAG TPA: tetratricopeptide repeat protein, partial [Spirochaetota bacterium]|nr:tetratricopeptide repeat protein [Spirochaetota bacterium]
MAHNKLNKKSIAGILYSASVFIILFLALFCVRENAHARDPQSINRQGALMGEKRQYKEAIDQFDRAIEIYDKESAQAYHNRAWAYELNGDIDKAIPSYEEALHRNPYQVISGEKVGYIYYKKGDYDNAIRVGELVLKHDPENKEVPKWLPDAYLKRMQIQKKLEQERRKKEEEDQRRKEEMDQLKKEKKERESTIVYATIDFMLRTGYDMSSEKYDMVYDSGFFVDVPERIFCRITPTPSWEIDLLLENPWLGGMMPSTLCVHN